MTILPKKKNSQQKSDNESTDANTHYHGDRHGHQSHLPQESRDRFTYTARTSPPTWPLQSSREDKRPAHSTSSSYEDYENVDSGPSHSKRRHRASPHRISRKAHNRDAHTHSLSSLVHRNNVSSTFNANETTQVTLSSTQERTNSATPEENHSGYNSEDEYDRPDEAWTEKELEERELHFERKLIKKGYVIKKMGEDGACLFRAVADQVYGDQEMHSCLRNLCIDYMGKNSDYFSQYVTEDFQKYLERKRSPHSHGNHVEMQAMSEMFNRPIEVYHYGTEPIIIFHGIKTTESNDPIRLSYHRNIHYNSIVDPYKATVGVGLGLPSYKPGLADQNLLKAAIKSSEDLELEQAMLEDKLRATDWEATNDTIEEQVARESYLEWLRENELRARKKARSATATSSSSLESSGMSPPHGTATGRTSPRNLRLTPSPKAPEAPSISPSHSPPPPSLIGGSKTPDKVPSPAPTMPCSLAGGSEENVMGAGLGLSEPSTANSSEEFSLIETASFMDQLPPHIFGLSDWEDTDILARVLAQSQQEYLDSLKKSNS